MVVTKFRNYRRTFYHYSNKIYRINNSDEQKVSITVTPESIWVNKVSKWNF